MKWIKFPAVIRIQHLIVLPVALFLSRIGMQFDSYIHCGHIKKPKECLGLVIHFTWIYLLFRQLESPYLAYFMASVVQGTLALQLISNHYWKPFIEINDQKLESFPKR